MSDALPPALPAALRLQGARVARPHATEGPSLKIAAHAHTRIATQRMPKLAEHLLHGRCQLPSFAKLVNVIGFSIAVYQRGDIVRNQCHPPFQGTGILGRFDLPRQTDTFEISAHQVSTKLRRLSCGGRAFGAVARALMMTSRVVAGSITASISR